MQVVKLEFRKSEDRDCKSDSENDSILITSSLSVMSRGKGDFFLLQHWRNWINEARKELRRTGKREVWPTMTQLHAALGNS